MLHCPAPILAMQCACCTTHILWIKILGKAICCIVNLVMQGKKHYTEKLFTSFQLSDRVPPDNFYRRLSSAIDLNFIYKLTDKYYGSEGQQSIDPVVFFKLILVGYIENLNSDRKIIAHSNSGWIFYFFWLRHRWRTSLAFHPKPHKAVVWGRSL